MAQDLFPYDKMVETALRGVARQALAIAARDGLRGGHHFYIGFRTAAAGVVLPPQLLAKYPEEMTIVLQHQFWGLEVADAAFSVSLSFSGRSERLTIPFAAITTFADPSVKFGLQFEAPAPAAEVPVPTPLPAGETAASEQQAARQQAAGQQAAGQQEAGRRDAEIVTLDRFRKR